MNVILGYLLAFMVGFGITIAMVGHVVIGGLIFVFVTGLLVLGSIEPDKELP